MESSHLHTLGAQMCPMTDDFDWNIFFEQTLQQTLETLFFLPSKKQQPVARAKLPKSTWFEEGPSQSLGSLKCQALYIGRFQKQEKTNTDINWWPVLARSKAEYARGKQQNVWLIQMRGSPVAKWKARCSRRQHWSFKDQSLALRLTSSGLQMASWSDLLQLAKIARLLGSQADPISSPSGDTLLGKKWKNETHVRMRSLLHHECSK